MCVCVSKAQHVLFLYVSNINKYPTLFFKVFKGFVCRALLKTVIILSLICMIRCLDKCHETHSFIKLTHVNTHHQSASAAQQQVNCLSQFNVTDNSSLRHRAPVFSSSSSSSLSVFFKLCGFYFRRAHEPNLLIFTRNRSGSPSHTG